MKRFLHSLQLGEALIARVQEVLSNGDVIISLGGDLLRVHNETRQSFKAGDAVKLTVTAVRPLRFSLKAEQAQRRRQGHFDVNV